MQDLSWPIVFGLGSTGILMALLSSLVGMRQKVEVPAWWGLYAIWVVVVLSTGNATPFRTILCNVQNPQRTGVSCDHRNDDQGDDNADNNQWRDEIDKTQQQQKTEYDGFFLAFAFILCQQPRYCSQGQISMICLTVLKLKLFVQAL